MLLFDGSRRFQDIATVSAVGSNHYLIVPSTELEVGGERGGDVR